MQSEAVDICKLNTLALIYKGLWDQVLDPKDTAVSFCPTYHFSFLSLKWLQAVFFIAFYISTLPQISANAS